MFAAVKATAKKRKQFTLLFEISLLGKLESLFNSPLKCVLEVNSCTSNEEQRHIKAQKCVFVFDI